MSVYLNLKEHFADAEIIELMPKSMEHVLHLIGLQATINLIHCFGGIAVYVPSSHGLNIENKIVKAIGLEDASRLSRHFKDTILEVPKAEILFKSLRNKAIVKASEYMSRNDLAIQYKLTQKHIRNIIQKERNSMKPKF